MKNKHYYYLKMLGKYTIYTYIFSVVFFSVALANNSRAQGVVSVKEAIISLDVSNEQLAKVFDLIERKTNYVFVYDPDQISDQSTVTIKSKRNALTVEEVLLDISRQTNVGFRQVNDRISVKINANSKYKNGIDVTIEKDRITGKVVDETGEALPGATIIEKGTTNGTTTDLDGSFQLEVDPSSVLLVSFVGYETLEIVVGDRTVIDVQLKPDLVNLQEVVVVGYGTQSKKTLTGSVVQVKGDDIMRSKPTSSAALALQGEAAGVIVTRESSRPGQENLNIQIRGNISVNGVSPLILLDGLVIPESQFSTINPNDIESISILKDGSAAIYGNRAAGGVILVTTKKGIVGAPKVEYNAQFQMNTPYDFPLTSMNEWAALWLEAGYNDVVDYVDVNGDAQTSDPTHRFYTADQFQSMLDGTFPLSPETVLAFGTLELRHQDISQYDAVYGNTWSQRHNIAVSGGSGKVNYRTSFGYNNERSPIDFVYDGAKRFNFRTNLSYAVNDIISTDFSVSFDHRVIDEPNQGVGEGVQDPHFFPLYNPLGQYYDVFGGNNLLAKLDEGGRNETTDQIIRFSTGLTFDLDRYVKGLSFGYDASFSFDDRHRNERRTSVTMYDWEGNVSKTPTTLLSSSSKFYDTQGMTQMHTLRGNYRTSFDKHNFGFTAIFQAQLDEEERNFYSRSNFATDDLNHINLGDVTTSVAGGDDRQSNPSRTWFRTGAEAVGIMSYVGRINYDYDGVYLFEALARRDGSSRLDPEFRWANFYGASAGVRISEMAFMPRGTFDDLKLRVSYGETGSTQGISAYDYVSSINTTTTAVFGTTPAYANTAYVDGISTNERTWERVSTTNVALDFAVLSNRLSGVAEYFVRKNDDMLISVTYPVILGASAPLTNSGNFKTKGWELSLNWKDNIGDLRYNVGFQLWDSRSKVTSYEGAEQVQLGLLDDPAGGEVIEGKPIYPIYTYVTDGIMTTEAEVLEYYQQYGFESSDDPNNMKAGTDLPAYNTGDRLVPGNVKRVDVNGDGLINEDDRTYYGDANPHYSMGIRLGAEWKGFDFNAFFQGVMDQNIVRTGALAYPLRSWWKAQNSTFVGNTWNEDNTDADFPMMFFTGSRKNWNYNLNDINVVQASYLRAKLISLGYTLPEVISSKVGLERVRVSVTGSDLFVISNVKDGLDPEMRASADQGATVPYAKSFIFGLDISF